MANGPTLLASGIIYLNDGVTDLPIFLYSDGIKISASERPAATLGNIFRFFARKAPGEGNGHLVFTNVDMTFERAIFNAKLLYTPNDWTLTITLNSEFGHLPNVHFKELEIVFKQKKTKELKIDTSKVTLAYREQSIPLIANLTEEGLSFNLANTSHPVTLTNAGVAHLENVDIQTNVSRLDELRALHWFTEKGEKIAYDGIPNSSLLNFDLKNTKILAGGGLELSTRSVVQSSAAHLKKILDLSAREISFECWVKPTTSSQLKPRVMLCIGKPLGTAVNFFQIALLQNGKISISGTVIGSEIIGPELSSSTINRIVFTRDINGTGHLYIDGKLVASKSGIGKFDTVPASNILSLGNNTQKTNSWNGVFYNLAIYSRALGLEEIQNHFRPIITMSGHFEVKNAPSPLDAPLPANFFLVQEKPQVKVVIPTGLAGNEDLEVRPELRFSNLNLLWEENRKDSWILSGSLDAAFWRNKVTLQAKLIGTKTNPLMEFTHKESPIKMGLETWGNFNLNTLTLNVVKKNQQVKWDLICESSDEFVMLPTLKHRSFDLFADFLLDGYQLKLTYDEQVGEIIKKGRLVLAGNWLEETLNFKGNRTSLGLIMEANSNSFELPFDFEVPPIKDPKTGFELFGGTHIEREVMKLQLDLALSQHGLLTKITESQFSLPLDGDFLGEQSGEATTLKIPSFTLYTPPPNKNALLGEVLKKLAASSNELFLQQVRHVDDFNLGERDGFPALTVNAQSTTVNLPRLFRNNYTDDGGTIFKLIQTGDTTALHINFKDTTTQVELDTAYQSLWDNISKKEKQEKKDTKQPLFLSGAIPLLKRSITERIPVTYQKSLQYYYGWHKGIGKNYIDLVPGMRLRIDFQNYQFVQASDQQARSGFTGSGSTYLYVNSYKQADKLLTGFDTFLSATLLNADTAIVEGGGGGIGDLVWSGGRKRLFRLFYPTKSGKGVGPERVAAIIGDDFYFGLENATSEMIDNGSIAKTDTNSSFFFKGKTTVIPEIPVFVGDQEIYVSVGTTWRQLLERFKNIPAVLPGQDLKQYSGKIRPLRLFHKGVDSEPTYVFINPPSAYTHYADNQDFFDLPLVKGDRFFL